MSKKIEFTLWDTDEPGRLPDFINTENIIIEKEYVPIMAYYKLSSVNNIMNIMFKHYGGIDIVEQFNVIKKLLPLVLVYNGVNDILELKDGMIIELPDLNNLLENTYIIDYSTEDTIPGLNPLFKSNKVNITISDNDSNITKLSNINIKQKKINYDNESGILTF